MTQDKTVASHRISLAELVDNNENRHWAQAIDTNLNDGEKGETYKMNKIWILLGKTNLKSTVALRRLDGHPRAFIGKDFKFYFKRASLLN